MPTARERAAQFCRRFNLSFPIIEAPMAGANSLARSIAVANAGGMAGMGALLSTPQEIAEWRRAFREQSRGALLFNLWVPDPPPIRNAKAEAAVRDFMSKWGPELAEDAGNIRLQDFAAQCAAVAAARPTVVSSIMGIFPEAAVRAFKDADIAWFATATTLAEARAAQAAGADAIVAQGFEAGGHRGAFKHQDAERQLVGLLALVPRLADAIDLPIVATGGIADGRGIAAALTLGASAVQIGTAFLRSTEAETPPAWSDALATIEPEETWTTRAFSGRLARAIASDFVRAAAEDLKPAPYPVQRGFTAKMNAEAKKQNDISRIQAWAGQSAWMAKREPAAAFVKRSWDEAQRLLP
jgi:nitronate monooxygenase